MTVPGRYAHNPDPELAELLHQVTLEGWGNDSCGDVDQDGFHATLLIVDPPSNPSSPTPSSTTSRSGTG
jgi:hypothetical protein